MSEIADRIAALEAELAALKAHVAETEAEADEAERTSRRAVFRKLAIGAAGVATGASVLRAEPVAAANNQPLTLGVTNDATAATRADYLGPGSTTGFLFQSGNGFGPAGPTYPAALAGWSGATGTLVHGVYGFSAVNGGAGVVGNGGGGVGGFFTGARAALQLGNRGPVDAIDFSTVQKGDVLLDDEGDLWLGTAAGEARKLGGRSTAGVLHLLPAPPRAYDSRTGSGAGTGYLSASNSSRVVNLATGKVGTATVDAVPADAKGALLSVTLDATIGSGFLAVYQDGIAWPGNSNLNWYTDGQILAVTTVSAVAGAKINLKVGGGGSTQVVVDVIGYYL